MHRFYCHCSQIQGARVLLDGPEAIHAFRVLRLRAHDVIALVDDLGREYQGSIESIRGSKGVVRIASARPGQREKVRLALAAALPKARVFDDIVDRATQLGVSVIIPMITERTVVRLSRERAAAKLRRWQKKAIEAVKQCGRTSLPAVLPVQSLHSVLSMAERYEQRFMGSLQPDAVRLKELVAGRPPVSALVLVGPEGDFSPEEYRRARAAGVEGVSLGSRILRCETAITVLLGILSHEWDC